MVNLIFFWNVEKTLVESEYIINIDKTMLIVWTEITQGHFQLLKAPEKIAKSSLQVHSHNFEVLLCQIGSLMKSDAYLCPT